MIQFGGHLPSGRTYAVYSPHSSAYTHTAYAKDCEASMTHPRSLCGFPYDTVR